MRRVAMLPTRQLMQHIFLLLLASQTAAVKRVAHIESEARGRVQRGASPDGAIRSALRDDAQNLQRKRWERGKTLQMPSPSD